MLFPIQSLLPALRSVVPLAAATRSVASQMAAQVNVLVPVADSSEDIETACITDVLVRAGAKVTVASVMPAGRLQVTMARGLKLTADTHIDACTDAEWDAIALPGGMPGAEHLSGSEPLTELLKNDHHLLR